jgi:hypothetical protein
VDEESDDQRRKGEASNEGENNPMVRAALGLERDFACWSNIFIPFPLGPADL